MQHPVSLDAGLRMDGIPALDLCGYRSLPFFSDPIQENKDQA